MVAKISLVLSIVLAIAVGYLLVKTNKKGAEGTEVVSLPTVSAFSDADSVRAPVIAFVDGDTLNARYGYIIQMDAQLQKKKDEVQRNLTSKLKVHEDEIQKWYALAQQRGDNMSQEEMGMAQQDIAQRQQEMEMIKEKEYEQFDKYTAAEQEKLYKKVHAYFEKYAREKGIDAIVGFDEQAHLVLYKNQAYDITSDVLVGLNAEYNAELAQETK